MSEMDKPSLPSIQFLLQEAPEQQVMGESSSNNRITPKRGHRQSHSVSSLPSDLQILSLHGPPPSEPSRKEPYNGIPFSSTEKTPSWMIPTDRPNNNEGLQPRRRGGHGRSVSEFTLPPLSPTPTLSVQKTSSHRRTVSANTIDFMLAPTYSPRAQSYSPQEQSLSNQTTAPHMPFFDQLDTETSSSGGSGRYICSYCQKKFSRPSSLRIHTYSHTGEKPFVCTEPGCGRHFSVQSNMRRHLRVHRLSGKNHAIHEE